MIKKKVFNTEVIFLSDAGYGFLKLLDTEDRVAIYFHASTLSKAGFRFQDVLIGDQIVCSDVVKTGRGHITRKILKHL